MAKSLGQSAEVDETKTRPSWSTNPSTTDHTADVMPLAMSSFAQMMSGSVSASRRNSS
jgi:hypothetical protein